MTQHRPPLIGISANLEPASPERETYHGKRLEYAERGLFDWVLGAGGIPVLLPLVHDAEVVARYLDRLDGLVLAGGDDVAPEAYGESPRRPEWAGVRDRDVAEFALLDRALELDLPVCGVCRGLQVLNVYFGGSLHQDLVDDGLLEVVHKNQEKYDGTAHAIDIAPKSWLAGVYPAGAASTNSVHHQGIDRLATGLEVMAISPSDGLVEAIRHPGYSLVVGVQWHPEWADGEVAPDGVLSGLMLGRAFVDVCRRRIEDTGQR